MTEPTHGGLRKGAGRPYLKGSSPGKPSQKIRVILTAELVEKARKLGDENISKGIRIMIMDFGEPETGRYFLVRKNGQGNPWSGWAAPINNAFGSLDLDATKIKADQYAKDYLESDGWNAHVGVWDNKEKEIAYRAR